MDLLDEKDCKILELLQSDCRMSYTEIAKEIGLSVDSTKKRINKMIKNKIFFPKIQLRPRNFGFKNVVEVKIKLHNYSEDDKKQFIDYLVKNPFVVEIINISGDWDITIVLLAKDAIDLGYKTNDIRNKFSNIISDWMESLTTLTYKFEDYDMRKILEYNKK